MTPEEIEIQKEGAQILGKVHGLVSQMVQPGVRTMQLDALAQQFITDHGAVPSFKGYRGSAPTAFPGALCISVNEVVVHGIPGAYELKDGDIVSIDCGVYYRGFHSDSAYTYTVGEVAPPVLNLLRHTLQSLFLGIAQAKAGNRVGDISHAVQSYTESRGYGVVRELVGHGVGRLLHEKPEVPNYGQRGRGQRLATGMVIAIEPMITLGRRAVVQEKDGWTIRTSDRKPAAHFEHTVSIQNGPPEVITTFQYIDPKFHYLT
jgi:methionyl aminopeptidase